MTNTELAIHIDDLEEQIEEKCTIIHNIKETIILLRKTNMDIIDGTKKYIEELVEEIKIQNTELQELEKEQKKYINNLVEQLQNHLFIFEK